MISSNLATPTPISARIVGGGILGATGSLCGAAATELVCVPLDHVISSGLFGACGHHCTPLVAPGTPGGTLLDFVIRHQTMTEHVGFVAAVAIGIAAAAVAVARAEDPVEGGRQQLKASARNGGRVVGAVGGAVTGLALSAPLVTAIHPLMAIPVTLVGAAIGASTGDRVGGFIGRRLSPAADNTPTA